MSAVYATLNDRDIEPQQDLREAVVLLDVDADPIVAVPDVWNYFDAPALAAANQSLTEASGPTFEPDTPFDAGMRSFAVEAAVGAAAVSAMAFRADPSNRFPIAEAWNTPDAVTDQQQDPGAIACMPHLGVRGQADWTFVAPELVARSAPRLGGRATTTWTENPQADEVGVVTTASLPASTKNTSVDLPNGRASAVPHTFYATGDYLDAVVGRTAVGAPAFEQHPLPDFSIAAAVENASDWTRSRDVAKIDAARVWTSDAANWTTHLPVGERVVQSGVFNDVPLVIPLSMGRAGTLTLDPPSTFLSSDVQTENAADWTTGPVIVEASTYAGRTQVSRSSTVRRQATVFHTSVDDLVETNTDDVRIGLQNWSRPTGP